MSLNEDLYPALGVALWALTVALMYLLLATVRHTRRGRRPEARAQKADIQREVRTVLTGRPTEAELVAAWRDILPVRDYRGKLPNEWRLLALLAEKPPESLSRLRDLAQRHTDVVCDVARLADNGLLRAQDFVEKDPLLHMCLIRELPLVTPFIWYESLIRGLGRRGYLALQWHDVLVKLRSDSMDSSLADPIMLRLHGQDLLIHDRIGTWRRGYLWCRHKLSPPALGVRAKMKQRRQAARLSQRLRAAGYPAVELDSVRKVVDW